MKIAFLSFYSGAIDRGVEVATAALAKGLSQKHDVTVFQAGERIFASVPTVRIPMKVDWDEKDTSSLLLRKIYLDYWSRQIFQFTRLCFPYLMKNKFDVIIPTNGGWQILLCRLLSWQLAKKMLVQGNAGIGRDDLFQMACFPDTYVAISPAGFRWARHFFPWIKKIYIPYGVDIKQISLPKPVSVPLSKPLVLCVAAFSPYKQIDLLIQAMVHVPQASLLVIGQGVLESHLRELGKKLLGERFMLKTGITHDQLPAFYKSADVFSLPSASSEAFGIVYVEALAAGLTVVAPDDYNRRVLIGEAGFYTNPHNTREYALAIKQAIKSDLKNKAKEQAKKYAWENIVNEYDSLLNQLI